MNNSTNPPNDTSARKHERACVRTQSTHTRAPTAAHLHDLRAQQAFERSLRAKHLLGPAHVSLCPAILLLVAFVASLPLGSPCIGFPRGQCVSA
jgi:hypothetical protein